MYDIFKKEELMEKTYIYNTSGVCARQIKLLIKDNKIEIVKFVGGCNGNQEALFRLIQGKDIKEVATLLRGIKCGRNNTSCPDQLAQALEDIINKEV